MEKQNTLFLDISNQDRLRQTQIKEVLKNVGSDILFCERINEQSFSSQVYLLEAKDNKQLILKFSVNPMKFQRELGALELLADENYVPNIVKAIPPCKSHQGILILSHIKGNPLRETEVNAQYAEQAGSILGQLHQIKVDGVGHFGQKHNFIASQESWWDFKRKLFFRWYGEVLSELDYCLARKCFDWVSDFYNHLPICDKLSFTHFDYRPSNWLVNEGRIEGVIDFESTRGGDPVYDLTKVYRLYAEPKPCIWEAFLTGYESQHSLGEKFLDRLAYYELDVTFSLLAWAKRRGDQTLFNREHQRLKKIMEKTDLRQRLQLYLV